MALIDQIDPLPPHSPQTMTDSHPFTTCVPFSTLSTVPRVMLRPNQLRLLQCRFRRRPSDLFSSLNGRHHGLEHHHQSVHLIYIASNTFRDRSRVTWAGMHLGKRRCPCSICHLQATSRMLQRVKHQVPWLSAGATSSSVEHPNIYYAFKTWRPIEVKLRWSISVVEMSCFFSCIFCYRGTSSKPICFPSSLGSL